MGKSKINKREDIAHCTLRTHYTGRLVRYNICHCCSSCSCSRCSVVPRFGAITTTDCSSIIPAMYNTYTYVTGSRPVQHGYIWIYNIYSIHTIMIYRVYLNCVHTTYHIIYIYRYLSSGVRETPSCEAHKRPTAEYILLLGIFYRARKTVSAQSWHTDIRVTHRPDVIRVRAWTRVRVRRISEYRCRIFAAVSRC